jgi:hypothetical protein
MVVGGRVGRRCLLACAVGIVAGGWLAPAAALDVDTPAGPWTVGGYGEFYSIFRTDDDTQRQRPAGIFSANVTGNLHPKVRFFLDAWVLVGGFPEDATGTDIYNLRDTFQNVSPAFEIDEVYLDFFLGSLDLRIGKQKFAWGRLDTFQPTDVLNPQWYNDPFLTEEEDAKIGVIAAQAAYYLPDLGEKLPSDVSFTVVWLPMVTSTRFPIRAERWFPPAVDVADVITLSPLEILPGSPIVIENDLLTVDHQSPEGLDESGVAVRLAGVYGSVDWSLSYYDGYETDPVLDFRPTVFFPEARTGEPIPFPVPGQPIRLAAESTLTPRFERIRMFGADAAYELSGFTFRAEGAYGIDRLVPRSVSALVSDQSVKDAIGNPDRQLELAQKLFAGEEVPLDLGDLFVTSDTIEWGIGVDYLYEGWLPLLQVNQTVVLDDAPELLIEEVDTQLLLALRKSFFGERLDTELITVQSIARGYTVGIARFGYDFTDSLRAQIGYLLLAGSSNSLYGQFHDNDEGFLRIRYSF